MDTIDKEVLESYNKGIEKGRLNSGLGLIEFTRTKEILKEFLPKPPAIIYDIGGGYGEYSYFLAAQGYEVHLFDISEKNIEMSKELGKEFPNVLIKAEVADARKIDRESESADAILFMGPLYHIVDKEERIKALNECKRLLKPNGVLFSAAITRFATTLWATTTYGLSNNLLEEEAFQEMIYKEIKEGHHIKLPNSSYRGMGRSYFHLPNELKDELEEAGFKDNDVRGIISCGWLVPKLDEAWKDVKKRETIMKIVRLLEKEESLMGLSTHILSISYKI